MHPRTKSSLLWGIVGLLAFIVLVRGYGAVTGTGISLPVLLSGAVLVGAVTVVATYTLEPKLLEKRQT